MKKSGFTLAEVLITLGIVGVVAALTAPALVMSSRNEANAAKLSVVVSNLENAFSNMMLQENADNIFHTDFGKATTAEGRAGYLAKYMHSNGIVADTAKEYYGSSACYYMANDGSKSEGTATTTRKDPLANQNSDDAFGNSDTVISLKSGATLFINSTAATEASLTDAQIKLTAEAGCSLAVAPYRVIIDVNGNAAPNVVGRDIFYFALGSDGILYPAGGSDYARYSYQTSTTVNWKDKVWNKTCTDTVKSDSGVSCTARVIAEGYKMNY